MFNYTHETVINSSVGTLEGGKRFLVYEDKACGVKHLVIERGGDYRADLVFPRTEGIIFKTPGYNGELAELAVAKPTTFAAGDYQFSVFVKLLDPAAIAEYAYPNWASFGKPIVVGFAHEADGEFTDELSTALKDAIPFNNKFVKVSVSDDDEVVLTASMYGLEFENAKIEKLIESDCTDCSEDKYELVKTYEGTPTKLPFGTGEMLVENYRFPTYANRRYAALNDDETPIPGALYTMYSFAYDSPRPGLGGLSGVGQKLDAVTRHIYWVNNAAVADFESAIGQLGTVTIKEKSNGSSDEGSNNG